MSALRPGPALDCLDCSTVSPVEEAHDFDPCPNCEGENTEAAMVEACPSPNDCGSEDHHFGYGVHVIAESA